MIQPHILICNDDGVEAEGIRKLTESLRDMGNITVFAPDGARSGMSCAITTTQPLRYKLLHRESGLTVYSCTGTPVDCVKLAVSEILPRKPDVVVSGINHGGNQALSVHYSGTMGAAFEGCVFGVPSVGVSLCDYQHGDDFSESCRIARIIIKKLIEKGLPYGVYLNLNIPNTPKVKGIRAARQTAGKWIREYRSEAVEQGETLYWLTGEFEIAGPNFSDNDIACLDDGYASLVPCRTDVTDYAFINELKQWQL